jgi:hypothetical protein
VINLLKKLMIYNLFIIIIKVGFMKSYDRTYELIASGQVVKEYDGGFDWSWVCRDKVYGVCWGVVYGV